MAQLHRRILRFPNRRDLAAFALACALPLGGVARADAPQGSAYTREGLAADARALRRDATRDEAIRRLCELPSEALPAIRERIRELRGQRATGDAGYAALGELGAAAAASGPSDPRDLLPGLLAFPDARYSPTHVAVTERYCLVRSLERMGAADALVAALPLLTHEIRAFRWQARHVVRRSGKTATAMVVRAAANPNAEVDLWAGWALATLGIRDSGDTVQGQTEESLIAVLEAYSSLRHIGAMPVVASFVDDPRLSVRRAARAGLSQYGDNAIWELRRLMQTRLGEDPGTRSAAVLLRDLGRKLDERREAPLRARAQRALDALAGSQLDVAMREAESLVLEAPVADATRALVPVFAAGAEAALARGDVAAARSAVERALRLAAQPSPELRATYERVREAEWARRGILEEATSEPVVAADGIQARIATRRGYARFGFVVAWLLLAAQPLLAVGRRLADEAARGIREARAAWQRFEQEGGRARWHARLRRAAEATGDHGRTLVQHARPWAAKLGASAVRSGATLVAWIAARAGSKVEHVDPSRAARASTPRAQATERPAPGLEALPAPVIEARPAPVIEARPAPVVERPAPALEQPAPVVERPAPVVQRPAPEPATIRGPDVPAAAPESPAARVRKERPVRRAVASPELFLGATPKARSNARRPGG